MHHKGLIMAAGGAMLAVAAGGVSPAGAAAKSPTAVVRNDILVITGSSADDTILVRSGATVDVDFGGDGTAEHSFGLGEFSSIALDAGSNDDTVTFQGSFLVPVTIDGGSGNDEIRGSNQVDTIDAGSGNDFVDGQQGNDIARMGSGTDTFQWDPGDGSDTVDGRSGTDTLLFNGANIAEEMRLFPEGDDAVFTRNVANIRMDMTKVERLDLRALGGADAVTVEDMSGTGFRAADVDLAAQAGGSDGAADTVVANGTGDDDDVEVDVTANGRAVTVSGLSVVTTVTGSSPAEGDVLRVDGRGGDDTFDVAAAVANLIQVVTI